MAARKATSQLSLLDTKKPEAALIKQIPQKYFNLLEKTQERIDDKRRAATDEVASVYVPKLFKSLEKSHTPENARRIIIFHCVTERKWWKYETVRKYLDVKSKNPTKRRAGLISVEARKKKKQETRRANDKKAVTEIANKLESVHGLGGADEETRLAVAKAGYEAAKENNPDMEHNNGKLSAAEKWGSILVTITNEIHEEFVRARERSLEHGGAGLYVIHLKNGDYDYVAPVGGKDKPESDDE